MVIKVSLNLKQNNTSVPGLGVEYHGGRLGVEYFKNETDARQLMSD